MRCLEIGPGSKRIPGFVTVNIIASKHTDYVADARALPFKDGEFDIVYASHIIEHIPWYQTVTTLQEWVRVLKPGGRLEVWTVDAYKVAKCLVEYEDDGVWRDGDGWNRHGTGENPYLWCAGRIFAYAKKDGEDSVNWHRALFTRKHLMSCFDVAGLGEIRALLPHEVRGFDHGWINLGVCGTKH